MAHRKHVYVPTCIDAFCGMKTNERGQLSSSKGFRAGLRQSLMGKKEAAQCLEELLLELLRWHQTANLWSLATGEGWTRVWEQEALGSSPEKGNGPIHCINSTGLSGVEALRTGKDPSVCQCLVPTPGIRWRFGVEPGCHRVRHVYFTRSVQESCTIPGSVYLINSCFWFFSDLILICPWPS